jgi:SpoVK/Ycf46/Vps4 family AAA+-type ATPase
MKSPPPPTGPSLPEALLQLHPTRRLIELNLDQQAQNKCARLIREHQCKERLRQWSLNPAHKVLLVGPPGNGKTSLAAAIAAELDMPLLVVRYESLISSALGQSAQRLRNIVEYVKKFPCVLFFDEFEVIGKERDDNSEIGEIKRLVASVLTLMDSLQDTVLFIAATNHPRMLDNAAWRRFDLNISMPDPNQERLKQFIRAFARKYKVDFGYEDGELARALAGKNFSDVEKFLLSVVKNAVLESAIESDADHKAPLIRFVDQEIQLLQREGSLQCEQGVASR